MLQRGEALIVSRRHVKWQARPVANPLHQDATCGGSLHPEPDCLREGLPLAYFTIAAGGNEWIRFLIIAGKALTGRRSMTRAS
jgi:hypothetical protein